MNNYFIDREHLAIADLVPGYEMGFHSNSMIITRINVPEKHRGKKIGSSLLRQICNAADAEGIILILELAPSGSLNWKQLQDWYIRYGFVNTRHGVMMRKPSNKESNNNRAP